MTASRSILFVTLLGCVHAQTIASLRAPRRNQPLPPDQDAIYQTFSSRKKVFLVIGASTYPARNNEDNKDNVPFVEASAARVRSAFASLGYGELATLTGKRATRQNIKDELGKIQTLGDNYSVVVYYAGHALVDTNAAPGRQEIWLQVADQLVQAGNGISITQLIDVARGRDPSANQRLFIGRLILIIDSCYSGQANINPAFYEQQDGNGVLFTSSRFTEPSREIVGEDGTHLTAFGYFLHRALTTDWDVVDFHHYGYITYLDLLLYVKNRLREAFEKGDIASKMEPDCRDLANFTLVAYDPRRRQDWEETPYEKNLVAFQFDFNKSGGNIFGAVAAPIGRALGIGQNVRDNQQALKSIHIIGNGKQTIGVVSLSKDADDPESANPPSKTRGKVFVYQMPEGNDRLDIQFLDAKGKVLDSKAVTFGAAQPNETFKARAGKVGADIQAAKPFQD